MLPILRTSRGWRCLHDVSHDGRFVNILLSFRLFYLRQFLTCIKCLVTFPLGPFDVVIRP